MARREGGPKGASKEPTAVAEAGGGKRRNSGAVHRRLVYWSGEVECWRRAAANWTNKSEEWKDGMDEGDGKGTRPGGKKVVEGKKAMWEMDVDGWKKGQKMYESGLGDGKKYGNGREEE